MENNNNIAQLILNELEGIIKDDERKVLDDWIAQSMENQALYKQLTEKKSLLQALRFFDYVMSDDLTTAKQKVLDYVHRH